MWPPIFCLVINETSYSGLVVTATPSTDPFTAMELLQVLEMAIKWLPKPNTSILPILSGTSDPSSLYHDHGTGFFHDTSMIHGLSAHQKTLAEWSYVKRP